jgi:hypothetical protein
MRRTASENGTSKRILGADDANGISNSRSGWPFRIRDAPGENDPKLAAQGAREVFPISTVK